MTINEEFQKHVKASNRLMAFLCVGILYGGVNVGYNLRLYLAGGKGIIGMIVGIVCAVVCFVCNLRIYKSTTSLILSEKELEMRIKFNRELQQHFDTI